jgi:putative membrane fusion protein
MVKENERIPKGALLGYFINPQGQAPMRTQLSGIFTRQTDGLEQIFQEVDFQTATPEIFKYKTKQVSQDISVVAGQAIYKIVDSLQPTRLLIHFSQNDIDFDIKANQNVNIIMGGKDLGKAEIVEIKNDSGEMLLMVEFTSFCEELLNQRFIEVEVVFDSHSGCLIAEKALVEKEGKKGVYCLNGEDIVFKPVTVIKEKDNKIIVEGLNRNDMLLNNPRI